MAHFLPITVCGWGVIFCSYMLAAKSQSLYDIAYFWVFARPTIKSAVKSYVALAILAVIAYVANSVLGPGANYLFMAKPEDTPSILDILPPNFALRLIIMAAAISTMFFLAYLPWLIRDIKEKKKLMQSK